MSIKQFAYTSCDDPATRQGGWRVKEAIGLDEAELSSETKLVASIERIDPVVEVPIYVDPADRHFLPIRMCLTRTDAGHVRLSSECPAGIDGSGRPHNSFTHTIILPQQEAISQLGVPVSAYGADWWLSPFGAREVTDAHLDPDLFLMPEFPEYSWQTIVDNRPEFPRILDAVEKAVRDRRSGKSNRTLVVIEFSENDLPQLWLEAIERCCTPVDSWDIRFSTYERNVNPDKAKRLLALGYDVVFTPDSAQSFGEGVNVFSLRELQTPAQGTGIDPAHAPDSALSVASHEQQALTWGALLKRYQQIVPPEKLAVELMELETLNGQSADAAANIPAWGIAALMLDHNYGMEIKDALEKLVVVNLPAGIDNNSAGWRVLSAAIENVMSSSGNIIDTAKEILSRAKIGKEKQLVFQKALHGIMANPQLLLAHIDFAHVPFADFPEPEPEILANIVLPAPPNNDCSLRVQGSRNVLIAIILFAQHLSADISQIKGIDYYAQCLTAAMLRKQLAPLSDGAAWMLDRLNGISRQQLAQYLLQYVGNPDYPAYQIPRVHVSYAYRLLRIDPRIDNDFSVSVVSGDYANTAAKMDRVPLYNIACNQQVQHAAIMAVLSTPGQNRREGVLSQCIDKISNFDWLAQYIPQYPELIHPIVLKVFSFNEADYQRQWGSLIAQKYAARGDQVPEYISILARDITNPELKLAEIEEWLNAVGTSARSDKIGLDKFGLAIKVQVVAAYHSWLCRQIADGTFDANSERLEIHDSALEFAQTINSAIVSRDADTSQAVLYAFRFCLDNAQFSAGLYAISALHCAYCEDGGELDFNEQYGDDVGAWFNEVDQLLALAGQHLGHEDKKRFREIHRQAVKFLQHECHEALRIFGWSVKPAALIDKLLSSVQTGHRKTGHRNMQQQIAGDTYIEPQYMQE